MNNKHRPAINPKGFSNVQVVIEELDARFFEKMQPLRPRKVALTGPMLEKNRQNHPDMDDQYHLLGLVCSEPDYVLRDRRDSEISICYKIVQEDACE